MEVNVFLCVAVVVCGLICWIQAQDVFVSNLDSKCLRCLCFAASNCDMGLGCDSGYCGPYQIGRSYWMDAGRPTLFRDNPNSELAYVNCALTLPCAQGAVKHYLARYGKDCNRDGLTNCDDFAMINFNGAFECELPLRRNSAGRIYWSRYQSCGKVIR